MNRTVEISVAKYEHKRFSITVRFIQFSHICLKALISASPPKIVLWCELNFRSAVISDAYLSARFVSSQPSDPAVSLLTAVPISAGTSASGNSTDPTPGA